MELIAAVRGDRLLRRVVAIVLALDVAFIVGYAVTRALRALDVEIGLAGHPALRITTDGGIPEWLGYIKALACAGLCARLAAAPRRPVFGILAAVFAFVMLDDALDLHERWGAAVFGGGAERTGAWNDQELGEIVAWIGIAVTVAALVVWGLRSARRAEACTAAALLVPVVALAFFAVGIDALYGPFGHAFPGAGLLIDTLEDGGEMLAMTVALGLTAAAWRQRGETER